MRPVLISLAAAVVGCGFLGCGQTADGPHPAAPTSTAAVQSSTATQSTRSRPIPPLPYLKDDGDDIADHDRAGEDDDSEFLSSYGEQGSQAEQQAVAAVVKSYYLAALHADGAAGCALLAPSLAQGLASSGNLGKSCAAKLSALFKHEHKRILADRPASMVVIGIRVNGALGLALLGFRTQPEGQVLITREGPHWHLDALLDSPLLP